MTPQEAREAAAVMAAFADGKKIEGRGLMPQTPWRKLEKPAWDWAGFDYRVAPEPWTGKIWVHPDGNSQFHYPTIDAEKWAQGGWRLITVKEVADD